MKPKRGSDRASSKAPSIKGKKRSGGKNSQQIAKPQEREAEPLSIDKNTPLKPLKKTKAAGASSTSRKVRGQEKWMPMPKPSLVALESMLDPSILSILIMKRTDKEETQKHLNILKHRFLAECTQLKVPVQRLRDSSYSSRQHQEETKKSLVGEKTLSKLEEDNRAVVSTLWTTEEQITYLDDKCRKLREHSEEEEEKNKEIFQPGVLSLPTLPPRKDSEATLQDRMMKMVPNPESDTTARRLGKTLQKSIPIQDAQALLVPAQKYADQLPPHLILTNGVRSPTV